VLAGSTAFAIAEGAGWRNSLSYRPRQAPEFYPTCFSRSAWEPDQIISDSV
jgi:hypothetical protein